MCARPHLTVRQKVGGASAHTITDTTGTHGAPTASEKMVARET